MCQFNSSFSSDSLSAVIAFLFVSISFPPFQRFPVDPACRECYDNSMKILLSNIMQIRNLSIRQVSIATGISKSTVSRIANGEVSPTADTLELLAKGLRVRITDLIDSPYK